MTPSLWALSDETHTNRGYHHGHIIAVNGAVDHVLLGPTVRGRPAIGRADEVVR